MLRAEPHHLGSVRQRDDLGLGHGQGPSSEELAGLFGGEGAQGARDGIACRGQGKPGRPFGIRRGRSRSLLRRGLLRRGARRRLVGAGGEKEKQGEGREAAGEAHGGAP